LLLDCCAAASGAGAPAHCQATSVTETIAACGFETSAPQPGRFSFTNTLIDVLEDWSCRPNFTAAMLHCEILNRLRHEKPEKRGRVKKFEYRRSPIHIVNTRDSRARSVILSPRDIRIRDTDSSSAETPAYDLGSLTEVLMTGETVLPQVLITLALEEEQGLDVEQWRRWLQEFPAFAKYAKVQGVYKSNSTLLLLSIPVVVWDFIPGDPACNFIGYVHSENLVGANFDFSAISRSISKSVLSSISLQFHNIISVQSKFVMTLVGIDRLVRLASKRQIGRGFGYLQRAVRQFREVFTPEGDNATPEVTLVTSDQGNQQSGKQLLEQAHILEDALHVLTHRNDLCSWLTSEILPRYDNVTSKLEDQLKRGKFDSEIEKRLSNDLESLKTQREIFSGLGSVVKEPQKVIDAIQSQVISTRQELDEEGGVFVKIMRSSRYSGLWWPPWWFQLLTVILLTFALVLGQVSSHSPKTVAVAVS
jgi:hypothetical protein